MKVIIDGVTKEIADDYAARLIEQGRAAPAPPTRPAPKANGKRRDKEETRREPKNTD